MLIILAYLLVAIFAPLLAPFGEAEVVSQMPYAPPDAQFLLGTDQLGRDQLSRLIYGARNSMGIALATTLISFTLGSLLGITAAVLGGWVDQVLSRFVDVIMAIPQLIFALILLSIAGSSIPNLIIIIALLDSTRVFRVSRAVAMNVVAMEFIEAARLRGEGLAWIIRREILPNIMPTLIAEFGLRFCFAFLTISALSFLGLGIQPPTADWGSMVREASSLIAYGNLTLFIPAIAIAVLTISVNLVVDWFLDRASGLRNAN
nr:ABC transporter permease [Paracoccus sulfuroxidans]